MATIKDVASEAGVSATTVSMVINGKGPENRIPEVTINKIMQAMQKLGYQPNLTARRLRNSAQRKPVLAFYWPLDYRTYMLGNFLSFMEAAISAQKAECELIVQTYINDHIQDTCIPIRQNDYNAVIVGAASDQDVAYLETLNPQMPIFLINRESSRYSTVGCDSEKIGSMAASMVRQKGYTESALIKAERSYVAMSKRTLAYLDACQQLDIRISSDWIFQGTNTIRGGSAAAELYCALKDAPHMIFCESDAMAQGVIYTLTKKGLKIQRDYELLCVAMQQRETLEYLIPSVSCIEMPTDKISAEIISCVFHQIETRDWTPVHISLDPAVYLRDSFMADYKFR